MATRDPRDTDALQVGAARWQSDVWNRIAAIEARIGGDEHPTFNVYRNAQRSDGWHDQHARELAALRATVEAQGVALLMLAEGNPAEARAALRGAPATDPAPTLCPTCGCYVTAPEHHGAGYGCLPVVADPALDAVRGWCASLCPECGGLNAHGVGCSRSDQGAEPLPGPVAKAANLLRSSGRIVPGDILRHYGEVADELEAWARGNPNP